VAQLLIERVSTVSICFKRLYEIILYNLCCLDTAAPCVQVKIPSGDNKVNGILSFVNTFSCPWIWSHYIQCLQKVVTPLDFFHILLCYSLHLNWIKYPIMSKWNCVLDFFLNKLITNKKLNVFNPFVTAYLNKFRSKHVFSKSHNKLHGLTLCAIIVIDMMFEWLPHLCTPHIQLSVRSFSWAMNFKQRFIYIQRHWRYSNALQKRPTTGRGVKQKRTLWMVYQGALPNSVAGEEGNRSGISQRLQCLPVVIGGWINNILVTPQ
jgi:hypothetical protein